MSRDDGRAMTTTRAAGPRRRLKVTKKRAPTRAVEQDLWTRGHEVVVGIDEVGRGAWAGPLMVGAAILPRTGRVNGVRDSKLLTESERERLFERIGAWCDAWSVGAASQQECDRLGMSAAQRLAARRAVEGLAVVPDIAVIDGRWDFVSPCVPNVELVVKADLRCLSVAAASILAKVTRDREMREHAPNFPHWSFETNKGYPCPVHKSALLGYGPSAIHRRTWVFMDNYVPWTAVRRVPPAGQTALF
jgi:ribonuclease HII